MEIVCMLVQGTMGHVQQVEVIFANGASTILRRPAGESLEVLGAQLNKLADRQDLNPLTVLSLDIGKEKS